MKLVFFSSVLNHHQINLCDYFYSLLGENFVFISTKELDQERIKLGYKQYDRPYVLKMNYSKESYNQAINLANNADVMIAGVFPFSLLKNRVKAGKLSFLYQERMFKVKFSYLHLLKHLFTYQMKYFQMQKKNLFILCASAYTSTDYKRLFLFKDKMYKWGYFPEIQKLDFEKSHNIVSQILWVGRLIPLKQCEHALNIAKTLKNKGYIFNLSIIGTGSEEKALKEISESYNLQDCVHFLGPMSPESVRQQMISADIFLFTSNFYEGWGAVLNEAMSCKCAVLAYEHIGSVPFLLKNHVNGIVCKNYNDMQNGVEFLLSHRDYALKLGLNAYETIHNLWNYDIAADRFISICKSFLEGESVKAFLDGPMSKA